MLNSILNTFNAKTCYHGMWNFILNMFINAKSCYHGMWNFILNELCVNAKICYDGIIHALSWCLDFNILFTQGDLNNMYHKCWHHNRTCDIYTHTLSLSPLSPDITILVEKPSYFLSLSLSPIPPPTIFLSLSLSVWCTWLLLVVEASHTAIARWHTNDDRRHNTKSYQSKTEMLAAQPEMVSQSPSHNTPRIGSPAPTPCSI